MRFIVNNGKVFTLLLILFPLLGISASYLYVQYKETKKEIVAIVQESMLDKKHELLDNYINYLQNDYGKDFVETLKKDEDKRKHAEQTLRLMQNSEVQYIYLLYIDKKQKLRYLLDTTKEVNERGEFRQRFFPQKDVWKNAQKSKKTEVAAQDGIDKLWITMAYPVVLNDKTQALLGIDFSHKEYVAVKATLLPLERIYLYSTVFITIMLFSAFVQLIIYYRHRKKSFIDPLTGMFNRQYLYELLSRYPVDKFHVLLMDLDHFKQVNDIYGHDAGDIVLSTVAQRIRSVIRKQDILIRFGGEEFILLIPAKDINISMDLAQRIRKHIKASPISLEKCELNVTISMGLNPLPGESKDFDGAMKIADEGLYKAKQMGRDRVEIYDPNVTSKEEHGLESLCTIKDALELEHLFCMYQPIFNVHTLEVHSYELLIRMRDEENNIIEPEKFLPVIFNTQVYVHVTKRVIDFAVSTLREKEIDLNINLDVQDLFNGEILDYLLETFENEPQMAQKLTIEIYENKELLEYELAARYIKKVQDIGIKIALNNFGKGLVNIDHLLNIEVNCLKLDASLIHNIHQNEKAQKIVASIQNLADTMNIESIAEHVETKEELEMVKHLGVTYAQGYLLARPEEDFLC